MKKAAVSIIVVTNETSIASFVPTSAIQDGTAYAKYFRFSISLPLQVNVVQNFNVHLSQRSHDTFPDGSIKAAHIVIISTTRD